MPESGRLAQNVMHFARVLRAAGLPIGPDRVIDAVKAVEVAGLARRDDFYWTLASVFLDRREQFEIFDQAFHIFWRDPQLLERVMAMLLPEVYGRHTREEAEPPSNRVAEALYSKKPPKGESREPESQEVELEATLTFSAPEGLAPPRFGAMTPEEVAQGKKIIPAVPLPIPLIR